MPIIPSILEAVNSRPNWTAWLILDSLGYRLRLCFPPFPLGHLIQGHKDNGYEGEGGEIMAVGFFVCLVGFSLCFNSCV